MYSLMKSSSHRSFFMETAKQPLRSTLTSHSSTIPLKLLDAAIAAAIFSSLICSAESFPFARTLCASSRRTARARRQGRYQDRRRTPASYACRGGGSSCSSSAHHWRQHKETARRRRRVDRVFSGPWRSFFDTAVSAMKGSPFEGGSRYHQIYHQNAGIRWRSATLYGIPISRKSRKNQPLMTSSKILWERVLVTPTGLEPVFSP